LHRGWAGDMERLVSGPHHGDLRRSRERRAGGSPTSTRGFRGRGTGGAFFDTLLRRWGSAPVAEREVGGPIWEAGPPGGPTGGGRLTGRARHRFRPRCQRTRESTHRRGCGQARPAEASGVSVAGKSEPIADSPARGLARRGDLPKRAALQLGRRPNPPCWPDGRTALGAAGPAKTGVQVPGQRRITPAPIWRARSPRGRPVAPPWGALPPP